MPTKCIAHMPNPKKHEAATDQIALSFLKSDFAVRADNEKEMSDAITAIRTEIKTNTGS